MPFFLCATSVGMILFTLAGEREGGELIEIRASPFSKRQTSEAAARGRPTDRDSLRL